MRGLKVFKDFFKGYENNYVIIGGTACTVLLNEMGENFRATKDFDIVLIIENIDNRFVSRFWDFINAGRYKNRFLGKDKSRFYRFEKPEEKDYPVMIELFSRLPNNIEIYPGDHLVPLHIAEDISSLSAILLNDDYYSFLLDGIKRIDGVSILDEIHLIPFKAKAWCELKDRSMEGEIGLTSHLKKHMKDIALLLSLIGDNITIEIKNNVLLDMENFINQMELEILDDYTTGIKNMSTKIYCNSLRKIYCI